MITDTNKNPFKSRKFIAILIWQVFILAAFIHCFAVSEVVAYMSSLMYACMILSAGYISIQGVQDIKNKDAGKFKSRKYFVMCLQLFYILLGACLMFYFIKNKIDFDEDFITSIIFNGGSATAAQIGVSWTSKRR